MTLFVPSSFISTPHVEYLPTCSLGFFIVICPSRISALCWAVSWSHFLSGLCHLFCGLPLSLFEVKSYFRALLLKSWNASGMCWLDKLPVSYIATPRVVDPIFYITYLVIITTFFNFHTFLKTFCVEAVICLLFCVVIYRKCFLFFFNILTVWIPVHQHKKSIAWIRCCVSCCTYMSCKFTPSIAILCYSELEKINPKFRSVALQFSACVTLNQRLKYSHMEREG